MPRKDEEEEEDDEGEDEEEGYSYLVTWRRDDGFEYAFIFESEKELEDMPISKKITELTKEIATDSDIELGGGKIVRIEEVE
jgi:hypothetical protein